MLQLHETIAVPSDHILHLNVPDVPKGEEVEVFIYSKNGEKTYEEKIALLAKASSDPLFLADMEEIDDDFSATLGEHI
jgi:hypothetical protein